MELTRRGFVGRASLSAFGACLAHTSLAQQQTSSPATVGAASSPPSAARATTAHSLTPVPIENVTIDDVFWSPKRKVWQEVTIRDCFRKFESDRGGALNNFDKVRDGKLGGHAGDPWMDGLVYEMIRGASDFLLAHPDPALEQQLDGYAVRIAAAAAKDERGYLNTYTQLVEPGHEWGLHGGLQIWQHEIYNLGALVDAGVAYYRATGKMTLLVPAVRISNYMYDYMGPAPKKNIVPCHPLPEEAMVRLYELFREQPGLKVKISLTIDETHYLQLAEFWIENRGHHVGLPEWEPDRRVAEQWVRDQKYGDGRASWGAYAQDDRPVFEQEVIEGHAVRATLLCAGIAAAARVNDNARYRETAVRLWENMVYKRMHITGGVGAFAQEEKFGPDYLLPNDAYLETCAAIGAGFFHRNMNLTFGDARYVDELERVLYNGVLSGVSLKGDTYLYENPLESGIKRSRWVWHECPCCPPMFVKFMGAMPGYIYATDRESVYVNLFVSGRAKIPFEGGTIQLKQTSNYPWDGEIRITIEEAPASTFHLMVRIPGWCHDASLSVNGKSIDTTGRVRGYVRIPGAWKKGDVVELILPMPVEQVRASPMVRADLGKAAVMRGPIIYCFESADNGNQVRRVTLDQARFSVGKAFELDGSLTLDGIAMLASNDEAVTGLYRINPGAVKTVKVTAIPYYANLNRGPVDMTVWVPLQA